MPRTVAFSTEITLIEGHYYLEEGGKILRERIYIIFCFLWSATVHFTAKTVVKICFEFRLERSNYPKLKRVSNLHLQYTSFVHDCTSLTKPWNNLITLLIIILLIIILLLFGIDLSKIKSYKNIIATCLTFYDYYNFIPYSFILIYT